jgi:hypothetical protein
VLDKSDLKFVFLQKRVMGLGYSSICPGFRNAYGLASSIWFLLTRFGTWELLLGPGCCFSLFWRLQHPLEISHVNSC